MKVSSQPTRLLQRFSFGFILLVLSSSLLSAKPKAALIDVQLVFKQYHKTITAQAQISEERAKIEKDSINIIQTLNVVSDQLKRMRADLATTPEDAPDREQRVAAFEQKLEQARQLDQNRKMVSGQKTGLLNQKMAKRADSILKEIHEIIRAKSAELGYDLVFDKSGLNSSQVSFILYAKDAEDITALILAEVNKSS